MGYDVISPNKIRNNKYIYQCINVNYIIKIRIKNGSVILDLKWLKLQWCYYTQKKKNIIKPMASSLRIRNLKNINITGKHICIASVIAISITTHIHNYVHEYVKFGITGSEHVNIFLFNNFSLHFKFCID